MRHDSIPPLLNFGSKNYTLLSNLIIWYTKVMNTQSTAYVPGVCNINYKEIAYRRNVGHVGAAITVAVLAALMGLGLSSYLRLAIFLPALLAAAGYVQARQRFCVGYSAAGQHNAEEGSTTAVTVTDKDAIAKDKAKQSKMYRQMFVYATAVTVLALALPPYHF
jgi:hypothetical protein